ncbi:hypothetical protein C2S53_006196 [Perilla frutescens var. hirtella]|uniref:Late embryogenesis abundant protein LEA-2 subgroup domain-containing protein n=1 Tax=Perilla frutescens var. hirtella TaxID=608512 RepID=A0AAD4P082_PERFH|nr:hypothetical protein C2S53_006196 [Perilla frutescens var. hirtella]
MMKPAGKPTPPATYGGAATPTRRRPWLLIFGLTFIILLLLTCIILGFLKILPPRFQIESVSISFEDDSVAKWNIGFSVENPNAVTLRYREIGVSVGGRRPQSSTVASVVTPLFKHSYHARSLLSATVDVVLPSPRPQLSVDGLDFNVRFQTKYASMGRKATAVVACGDKNVEFSTSDGQAVMEGGPIRCEVVSS